MMKQYKVCGFSALMDAEMNTNDAEQASDLFETMMNSDCYTHGYVADNDTGEVYCHFYREVEGNGIKTTYWTAFA
jgi:hypothetical protein